MKRITIDKKEYTFEYSIEASLYDDCTKSVMDMFVKGGMVQGAAESNDVNGAMKNFLETIANIPQKTLTLFYAALLEHHGTDEGDGSVKGMGDAKKLLTTYLKEEKKSFRDVMGEMMEIMVNDSFFELIGLNQITEAMEMEKKSEKPSKTAGKNTSEQ